MNSDILVAYATKHGSTKEIAEQITAVLEQSDLSVTCLPVKEVTFDLAPFKAIILGSAIYVGRWRKEAVRFLEQHKAMLSKKRVWLFAGGPTGEGEVAELLNNVVYPDAVKSLITEIAPEDILLVHGKLDPDQLNIVDRWIIRQVKAPVGDFRDWDEIELWAATISEQLNPAPSPKVS